MATQARPRLHLTTRAWEHRWASPWLAVLAIGAAAAGIWFWNETAEIRAIRCLPAAERQTLYAHTLNTLQTTCGPRARPEGLADFCREQSAFIAKFPECDGRCAALVKGGLAAPAR
jgi:hypothetical protein